MLEASQGSPLERLLANEVLRLIAVTDEVHSWVVCGCIASPEDMAGNFERIVAITAPGASVEDATPKAPALALQRLQRDAKRWNDLLELCGHLGDSSDTVVTLSQDDACRTQHIKVGDRRFYGDSWGQVLDKAAKGDES